MATPATAKAAPAPEPLGVLRGHRVPVNTNSFLAPSTLVSGGADGAVKIWDLRSRREAATASSAHSKAGVLHACALGAASSTDAVSSRFVTQGRDGLVKVWDTESFCEGAAPLLSYYCGSYSFTKFATLRWPSDTSSSAESPLASDASAGENLIVCPGAEGNQVRVCACACVLYPCCQSTLLLTPDTPVSNRSTCTTPEIRQLVPRCALTSLMAAGRRSEACACR